jgi:hypothetical protein
VGDEVVLDAGRRHVARGLASSPVLERPLFAPPIAFTTLSLQLGWRLSPLGWMVRAWPSLCSCGLCPGCIGFSSIFH